MEEERLNAEIKYRLSCWIVENLYVKKVITRLEANRIRKELLAFYNPLTSCLGSKKTNG